jgi:hypothetical protein
MLMLAAPEGAYANAALFIALGRKLIAKEIISRLVYLRQTFVHGRHRRSTCQRCRAHRLIELPSRPAFSPGLSPQEMVRAFSAARLNPSD